MRLLYLTSFLLVLACLPAWGQTPKKLKPWDKGAFETGNYRNLFAEAGYAQEEIDAKLNNIFYNLFEGPNKVYFEQGDSLAYISDLKNNDVRTEGMSYGMMVAVQFDKKEMFDRLWRWSKKYMQHNDGALKGYFAWNCKTDGTRNAQGPASDGELYYITALIFASNRWGNDLGINYLKEAQYILDCAMAKDGTGEVTNFINMKYKLITFVPDVQRDTYTDPSYHIPAFYEVWAQWAYDGRSEFWRECAAASRNYLHTAIHPQTGLNPDQTEYDGSPHHTGRIIGKKFRFDSWRVPLNIALDYSWACKDREWQQSYGHNIQNFLYSQGIDTFVDQYNIDGTIVTDTFQTRGYKALRHSLGLVASSAAVSLVCSHPKSPEFIDRFWKADNKPYNDGYFDAYYDGFLQIFAFMHLSGNYRIIVPKEETTLSGLKPSDFIVEVESKPVALYVLKNKNGLEACITNYGGRLVSLMVPDKNSKPTDVVLGYDKITDYLKSRDYLGALIGRYGNRIANAKFTLDGIEQKILTFGNGHSLHGGVRGFHTCLWDAIQVNGQTLELRYLSVDGEAGFPGNLNVKVTYTLTDDNAVDIRYEATTDKPTVVNLTNHSYFNLSGVPGSQIADHLIQINADRFTPFDATFIPTGVLESVDGTPMDLRKPIAIGAHIDDPYEQLQKAKGYDHNWVLNTQGDITILAAKAISETSGIIMEVYTNEPCIQFYTGMGKKNNGKLGVNYPSRGAFCLETQHFPDSPNQPNFPSTVLRPGENYVSRCIYKFSICQSTKP
ncbi:aldose 1-epimerase [termite gut metagenome]|uniref:Aldose 1-epimerase n=1 Tax=termite gut metagenome TaxID=433724 RepID=A0A5J4SM43_9ZZZZ